jgi:putative endonuclease
MFQVKGGCVYILANKKKTTLYTGVSARLKERIKEHKERIHPRSFTAKYNVDILVWYEAHPYIARAIAREKQIKAGSRKKKEALINAANPEWKDLFEEL